MVSAVLRAVNSLDLQNGAHSITGSVVSKTSKIVVNGAESEVPVEDVSNEVESLELGQESLVVEGVETSSGEESLVVAGVGVAGEGLVDGQGKVLVLGVVSNGGDSVTLRVVTAELIKVSHHLEVGVGLDFGGKASDGFSLGKIEESPKSVEPVVKVSEGTVEGASRGGLNLSEGR